MLTFPIFILGMFSLIILFNMLCLGMRGGTFAMLIFGMECIGRGGFFGVVFIFILIIQIFAVRVGGLGRLATYLYIVRARGR